MSNPKTLAQVLAEINDNLPKNAFPIDASAVSLNQWFPISEKKKARVHAMQNDTKTVSGYTVEFGDLENVERDQYEKHPRSVQEVLNGEFDDVDNGQDGPVGDTHEPAKPNTGSTTAKK